MTTDFGKRVKDAREARKMSQDQLAAAAGTTQSTIERIENGRSQRSRYRVEVAAVLKISLSGDEIPVERPPAPKLDLDLFGARDFKIYASIEGGPGELLLDGEPIEVVPRPWYMRDVREGFGFVYVGESMWPKYERGDILIANPKVPLLRGKPAAFTSEIDGEFRATVKLFNGSAEKAWKVEQLNPSKKFQLDRGLWTKAYRIVGTYEGI